MAARAYITVLFYKENDEYSHRSYIDCYDFRSRFCSFDVRHYSKISVEFTSDTKYNVYEYDADIIVSLYKDGKEVEGYQGNCYDFERSKQVYDVTECYRLEIEFLSEDEWVDVEDPLLDESSNISCVP